MKKRTLFGLPGALVLLAALVSSCYTPGFDPVLTGIRLRLVEAEIVLYYDSHTPDTHEFIATLQPNAADWGEGLEVIWRTSCDITIALMDANKTTDENGESRATVVAREPGSAFVTVEVVGTPFSATSRVSVVERPQGGDEG